jgi:hypothetical protein
VQWTETQAIKNIQNVILFQAARESEMKYPKGTTTNIVSQANLPNAFQLKPIANMAHTATTIRAFIATYRKISLRLL